MSSAFLSVNELTTDFPIERGIKQGNLISPKLFSDILETAVLERSGNRVNGKKNTQLEVYRLYCVLG